MTENKNQQYKIILEYIKDLSIETPSASTLAFVRKNLANYIMDIDISSLVLKNNAFYFSTPQHLSLIFSKKCSNTHRLIQNNLENINNNYRWPLIVDKYEKYFKKILNLID
mgnify:CR=1 FL=1